ncbi:hypothetical protein E1162_07315 [Rhodobacteraceae bacterium RKSG542]|uniref:hypothetical protein n=1 Tax=Pseudovibrio flavus TaxID=2529854 RepID=UPI0012BC7F60|nr:hypothetical protein [Pseudovibrio flavus]MTI17046.1 hypothetical protein [Pseudovibrio flavus]
MVATALKAQKLGSFLGALSPRALKMLVGSIEAAALKGQSVPDAPLILSLAQGLLRGTSVPIMPTKRGSSVKRSILSPLHPFLVNVPPTVPQAGMVPRAFLPLFWQLLEDSRPELSESWLNGEEDERNEENSSLIEGLRAEVLAALVSIAEEASTSPERKKLRRKLGGEQNLEYFGDLRLVLERANELEKLLSDLGALPKAVVDLEEKTQLEPLREFIDQQTDVTPHVAMLLSHLHFSGVDEVVALAKALAKTDDMRSIASTPYASFVSVAIARVEVSLVDASHWREELFGEIAYPEALRAALDQLEAFDVAADLETVRTWKTRLSDIKKSVSKQLVSDFSALPTQLELLLCKSEKDQHKDTKALQKKCLRTLTIVGYTRHFADLLGMNGQLDKLEAQIEALFTKGVEGAIHEIVHGSVEGHHDNVMRLDASIYLAQAYFGSEYTALLRKRRNVAIKQSQVGSVTAVAS